MTTDPSVLDERPRPLLILKAVCCREWPVLGATPMGRCGYCGERPEVIGPWESEDRR